VFDLRINEVDAIKREMVALNRQLNFPEKFPRYRSFFEWRGMGCLLLDWMEGVPLAEIGKSGAVRGKDDVRHRVACLRELCSSLELVHRAGHSHRDIKPTNILLRDLRKPQNGVILIDFGLTAMKRGAIEGTRGFAAPEQFEQRDVAIDSRTDIFGVGAVAWWLMTGEEFTFFSNGEGVWSELGAGCLRNKVPAVGEQLERAILKSLSYRAANRQGSVKQLSSELGEAGR
jgi:serine/threonine protein kinase